LLRLDVDRDPEVGARYGVLSMPTLILFAAAGRLERLVGFSNAARVRRLGRGRDGLRLDVSPRRRAAQGATGPGGLLAEVPSGVMATLFQVRVRRAAVSGVPAAAREVG